MHSQERTELRNGAQRVRVEPRGDCAKLATRVDRRRGFSLRPGTEPVTQVGVHGGDGNGEGVADRDQQLGRDILAPAFHLGQVGGRATGLAGDLAEAAPLAITMAAQHSAQLLADLFGGYAQSRTHNAQSITPPGQGGGVRRRPASAGILQPVATLISVNVGSARASRHTDTGITGIDKRPSAEPVDIHDPGPRTGLSGLAGDSIGDPRSHGGTDQAVYAYAREDLDAWEHELGRPLPGGVFGENLTTQGLDVSDARIGERWKVGAGCVLEVTSPRIPCRTFAGWLEEQLWVRRFTERGAPGAYLRVIEPGRVRAGDDITVVQRPAHDVSIAMMFRAMTTEKSLQPQLAVAGDSLPEGLLASLRR